MSLFEGKALEVIHRLDETRREFTDMKKALLAAYGYSVDDLKAQFFTASLENNETTIQFAARLKGLFTQWQKKDGAAETVEGIVDLFLRAQFLKSCPEPLVARLKINKATSLDAIKETANSYLEAHGKRSKASKWAQSEPPLTEKHIASVVGQV